ncbi:MAG: S49 family peptidase [Terracidiphilus sp.]|nr:S49 family peptidase [Terracidiphilus sp.]
MQTTFRSPYFALLETYAPQLLAGPEARAQQPKAAQTLSAGQVGVFGVLGQNDWYTDTDYNSIRSNLRRALVDPSVRAIDLVIDSPGGSVLGLPETADAIFQVNKVKPVNARVVGIAASAAYWLASQASSITLTPSGEVGSVGVLDLHADISKALENAGVKLTAVTAGEHKVERAPFTPLSDDAKAHMQSGVNAWYSDFLSTIRRGRGARVSASSNYGGGRMLSAREAVAAGMVDFVSSL